MQWNKIILMKEKKFLFCYNFVHLYRSLDLPISIMYFGFLSVRVCAAANQVAVNKTTQFGDPDIAAHRSAHFSPQSLLLSLLSRRLAEGWTEKLMKSLGLHVNSLPVQRKTIRTWRLMMKGLCIITAGYIHLFPSLIAQVILYSGEPLWHHVEMAYLNTYAKSYSILFKWSSASIFSNRVPNQRPESVDVFRILFDSVNLTLSCTDGFEETKVSQKCS